MLIQMLIVSALAAVEVLDVWFHASITASLRARVDYWDGPIGDALRCRFCFGLWVAMALVSVMVLGQVHVENGEPWGRFVQLPVLGLAAAKLAGWAKDLMRGVEDVPDYSRMPGPGPAENENAKTDL